MGGGGKPVRAESRVGKRGTIPEGGRVSWKPRCGRAWGCAQLGRLGRCKSRSLSVLPPGCGSSSAPEAAREALSPSAPWGSQRGRAAPPQRRALPGGTEGTPLLGGSRIPCVPCVGGTVPTAALLTLGQLGNVWDSVGLEECPCRTETDKIHNKKGLGLGRIGWGWGSDPWQSAKVAPGQH